jgi:serine/threonine-protein kinase
VSVAVPPLEVAAVDATPAPAPAPAPTPTSPPGPPQPPLDTSTGSGQRIAGLVIGGAGVVGLGLSGLFAVLAKGKYNDSLTNCPSSPNVCNSTGVDQRNTALSDGNVSSVTFAAGLALLAGGAIVYFTAPHANSSTPTGNLGVSPLVGTNVGGALLQGSW